jgi:hypothetical protein
VQRSAHGLRLSQVTLYLGVYNRRMDGQNVYKVYEKRKEWRGVKEEGVYEEEWRASAGEAAGDFLFS